MKKTAIIILYGLILLMVLLGADHLFGSNVDWLGQHIVFPDTFRQAFYETGQLIPNFLFGIGGGQNIFNFIYYGFLSPGILLSYLLPFVDMTLYMICFSVVSYLASGIFVYQFLKYHFDETKAFWAALLFLTLTPMTYHFHHHIMFVWYIPFFILALMGLDRAFDRKKNGLFIVSAFCMILTNYYFSVGGLIFLFVYAVYRILEEDSLSWKSFFRHAFHCILLFLTPVLLSGFVLLPTAYALFSNGRTSVNPEETVNLILPAFKQYFYKYDSMGLSGILLFAVFGNLTCKNKKKSDWFFNIFLIFILICPVFMYVLNGFLYVRGKVLIACSVLFIYNLCQFFDRAQKREINMKLTTILSVGFVLLFGLARKDNYVIGLLLLLEIVIICCLIKWKKAWYVYPVVIALIASCKMNQKETYVTIDDYKNMRQEEIAELMEKAEKDSFYRTNVMHLEKNTANRVYGGNFHGTSIYSSTSNSLYQKFYETYMGNNEMYRNCFITAGAKNELFYNFMGARYIIGEKDPGLSYEQAAQGKTLNLYESKYAYPLVYKSIRTMNEKQFDALEFPHTAEYLMTHTVVSGSDTAEYKSKLKKCEASENYKFVQKQDKTYRIPLPEEYKNQILYLTFDIANEGDYLNEKDISITINGIKNKLTDHKWLYYNGNTRFDYVIPLENCSELTIEILKGRYDIRNLKMYTSEMIYTEYEEAKDLKVDEYSGKITCNVEAEEGEYLVTSIPYDKGFSAYINDEKAEVQIVNKAFVGIPLKEGNNSITIQYASPLFKEGVIATLLGVCLMIFELLKTRLWKLFEKHREIVMYLIFGVLTTLVSLVTYFLCTMSFLDASDALQLQIANIIAWIVSVMFAYVTNRKYVFLSSSSIVKEMTKFYLSRAGTLVIDMLLMYLLVTISGISDKPAKLIVQVIVIVSNYVLGKLLVFKGEHK